ncbi:unnamed protein product [Pleuronectes platessa]|uniref:Uncharacterized protein n=1 Tax=Pleuronectes platessa TaxID=8262 RepID=A0A9N7U7Q3_PLEPL|nr:unnamed protein product [Pleuronectes platessa]
MEFTQKVKQMDINAETVRPYFDNFFTKLTAEQWERLKSCQPDEATTFMLAELLLNLMTSVSNAIVKRRPRAPVSEDKVRSILGDTLNNSLSPGSTTTSESLDKLTDLVVEEVTETVNSTLSASSICVSSEKPIPTRLINPTKVQKMICYACESLKTDQRIKSDDPILVCRTSSSSYSSRSSSLEVNSLEEKRSEQSSPSSEFTSRGNERLKRSTSAVVSRSRNKRSRQSSSSEVSSGGNERLKQSTPAVVTSRGKKISKQSTSAVVTSRGGKRSKQSSSSEVSSGGKERLKQSTTALVSSSGNKRSEQSSSSEVSSGGKERLKQSTPALVSSSGSKISKQSSSSEVSSGGKERLKQSTPALVSSSGSKISKQSSSSEVSSGGKERLKQSKPALVSSSGNKRSEQSSSSEVSSGGKERLKQSTPALVSSSGSKRSKQSSSSEVSSGGKERLKQSTPALVSSSGSKRSKQSSSSEVSSGGKERLKQSTPAVVSGSGKKRSKQTISSEVSKERDNSASSDRRAREKFEKIQAEARYKMYISVLSDKLVTQIYKKAKVNCTDDDTRRHLLERIWAEVKDIDSPFIPKRILDKDIFKELSKKWTSPEMLMSSLLGRDPQLEISIISILRRRLCKKPGFFSSFRAGISSFFRR